MSTDATPTTGFELFRWAKAQEIHHGIGLLKYLAAWAALQQFPGRIIAWDADQVSLGHQECLRRLNRRAF